MRHARALRTCRSANSRKRLPPRSRSSQRRAKPVRSSTSAPWKRSSANWSGLWLIGHQKTTATCPTRVETANDLDTTIRSKLVDSLKEKYGGYLTAEFVVSPELLGGMRVRVGSDVWDGTVRNRLEQLQQQL